MSASSPFDHEKRIASLTPEWSQWRREQRRHVERRTERRQRSFQRRREQRGSGATEAGAGTEGGATCGADLKNDAGNCGKCGRSCGAGTCSMGHCVLALAKSLIGGVRRRRGCDDRVLRSVVGRKDLLGARSLTDVPKSSDGTIAPTPIGSGDQFVTTMVADGSDVYWIDNTQGVLRHWSKPSGAETIASIRLTAIDPWLGSETAMALDATHVYWTDSGTQSSGSRPERP
jgi:hypothetical protein